MEIKVLGPGCPKCSALAENAESVAKEMGLDYEIEKISDLNTIMGFGVFMTPGLVVDGEVKSVGKVPTADEIKKMLQK
ncbi:MAG: thioredoxin family protein [Desulfopila sp.]